MSEEIFDCHNWYPGFQHMCGGRMPHGVRGVAFFKEHFRMPGSCEHDIFFINLLNTGNAHLRMGLAGKDVGLQPTGLSRFLQISFQESSARPCNHDPPGFVSLSSNCKLIEVFLGQEVPDFEIADFLCPGSAGIHQVQKDLVTEAHPFPGIRKPEQD